jgi:hypothetical protein
MSHCTRSQLPWLRMCLRRDRDGATSHPTLCITSERLKM